MYNAAAEWENYARQQVLVAQTNTKPEAYDIVGNVILKEVEVWFTENEVADQTRADNGQRQSSTGQK